VQISDLNSPLTLFLYSATVQNRGQLPSQRRFTVVRLENAVAQAAIDGTSRESDFGPAVPDRWSVRRSFATTFAFCIVAWSAAYLIYLAF
jgi:hypothetical protein